MGSDSRPPGQQRSMTAFFPLWLPRCRSVLILRSRDFLTVSPGSLFRWPDRWIYRGAGSGFRWHGPVWESSQQALRPGHRGGKGEGSPRGTGQYRAERYDCSKSRSLLDLTLLTLSSGIHSFRGRKSAGLDARARKMLASPTELSTT